MNGIVTITHLTLHEALRRRVLLLALTLGAAFLVIFALGFHAIMNNAPVPRGPTNLGNLGQTLVVPGLVTTAGLYAVNFMVVMMAALMPVDTLSGEIRSGAIQSLVTKPVRRVEVLLGKWLGFWLILMVYLLLMAGGILLVAWAISGYVAPNTLIGLALIMLEGTLLMTLSIAGGTVLSTLANGVMVFGLYGLAFIGGWIEQVSSLLGNAAGSNLGVISSLLVPSEALWHLAAYYMQPAILRDLGGMTPFTPAYVPSIAMVYWSLGYVLVLLLLGAAQFNRRDL